MKTNFARCFFLLAGEPVLSQKFNTVSSPGTCPSKYILNSSTNQCELDPLYKYDWSCNTDGSVTINNLNMDHLFEDLSVSGAAAAGTVTISSSFANSTCTGPTKSIPYTNFVLDSVTIQQADLCASAFKLDSSTPQNQIIEYSLKAQKLSATDIPHTILVGCGFSRNQKAIYDATFNNVAVPAAGAPITSDTSNTVRRYQL